MGQGFAAQRIRFIAFSLRDRLWRRDLGANGKIQKEQEQTEAQPDGARRATEQTGRNGIFRESFCLKSYRGYGR